MHANFHTHTHRCNHATGTEEEYISQAINHGIEVLGFSDHTPYFFPGDYYSHFRMRPELLDDYCRCISTLREKYIGVLQIHIGVEAEYYPAYFPELLSCLQERPLEYMILGQHFVGNEPFGQYSGKPTADPDILKQYCHQVMDAMQTGLYSCFAHPDIINFQGERRIFRELMQQVVREAKSCGIPLEINLLGLNEGRQYPSHRFFEIAAEENCPVIIGIDAHSPEAFDCVKLETAARSMVQELGLNLVDTLTLHPIR